MPDMLQTFMRMANLYNPYQPPTEESDIPTQLPVPSQSTYSSPNDYESTIGQPPSTLEAFRQSVLNPPKREHMTYPKSTLAGLTEALKIAAEPSPLEKNRVYVNGKPYQKQSVRIDPVTGEKQFITNVHEPSFGSQVMRAMPAAVSGAVDMLNQPYADQVADFELKNKGLSQAAAAESQMALAQQRQATANAIPERLAQGGRALDIKLMDAQTRQRLAALKDLPDSEKMRLLNENKITVEELRAANQYSLQELKGGQAVEQIGARGKETRANIGAQGAQTLRNIAASGEEARKTKGTPSADAGTTGQLPTQQKVALQSKTQRVLNEHPEWADYVTFNDQGFPVITMPDTHWGPGNSPEDKKTYDAIYNSIYGTGEPAPITTPPAAAKPPATKPPTKGAGKETGKVRVQAPDGSTGTWDLSKGPVPKGFKRIQ